MKAVTALILTIVAAIALSLGALLTILSASWIVRALTQNELSEAETATVIPAAVIVGLVGVGLLVVGVACVVASRRLALSPPDRRIRN